MHAACTAAYPDPMHYMHLNIKCLVSHSTSVIAAVAFRAAGLSIQDITYRLRWKAASVETYLRECYQSIGNVTQKAVTSTMPPTLPKIQLVLSFSLPFSWFVFSVFFSFLVWLAVLLCEWRSFCGIPDLSPSIRVPCDSLLIG
jgi:hypothetical protein